MKEVASNTSPEDRASWEEKIYQHRWNYLAWSLLYAILMGGFLIFEIMILWATFNVVMGVIAIGFTGLLFLLGLYMIGSYIKVIIRGRAK